MAEKLTVRVYRDLNGFAAVVHDGATNRHVTDPYPDRESAAKAAQEWARGATKMRGDSGGWGDAAPWMTAMRG